MSRFFRFAAVVGALFLVAPAFAAPLTINVQDPQVTEVEFNCGGEIKRVPVNKGIATLPEVPKLCTVFFVRRTGSIDGPGTYTCNNSGCVLDEVAHAPVSDGPGKVNVIFTSSTASNAAEINCPSGHRSRESIAQNTVKFTGVPANQDCTILLKGGIPAKYRPVRAGTYYCALTGVTLVCQKK